MIAEMKIMKGPNMWAKRHSKLIVLKVSETLKLPVSNLLQEIPKLFPEIQEELKAMPQSLQPQQLIAELVSRIALHLQRRTGATVSYTHTHKLGKNSYYAVFEYEQVEHGKFAATAAEALLTAIINGEPPAPEPILEKLSQIQRRNAIGPSTAEILRAAQERNIPITPIIDGEYILLGQGIHIKKIQATISDITGMIAVDIAGNKEVTKKILHHAMIPVPGGVVVTKEEELKDAVKKLGFPLVVKPLNGHQGKCVSTNIQTDELLVNAFRMARTYSEEVIIEKFIQGNDYRFLIVNYKFVAAAQRIPAKVTGNGKSTIQELIQEVNKHPDRGEGHNSILTRITVDDVTEKLLSYKKLTLDTVLQEGVELVLKDTANLSTGGTAKDVTDEVHPYNIRMAERIARIIGLDICGIDVMAPGVDQPFTKNGGSIIEVNAAPGIRMHAAPSEGRPRPVGEAIIDLLFPHQSDGRIPIVAVTGTNGKTTTSRLVAHIIQQQGFVTGLTTTDGIYINGNEVVSGDCSGPRSTAAILQDPLIEMAVLECARGGILRSGLAFDQCDIAIVTNVAADHLGLKDIYTIEDMAKVKSTVPQSVKPGGYAILNASNEYTLNMRRELSCNVALFTTDPTNLDVRIHCEKGGLAIIQEEDAIVICDGNKRIEIASVRAIPITLLGKAGFMIENVLPAALAAYILEIPVENIKNALYSFHPNEEQMPGRMNITSIAGRNIIVDYSHNPHGFKAFSGFIKNLKEEKTGIITGVGDRRKEDIIEVGQLAAEMYDRIIIRVDKDTRGRKPEEIIALVREGVHQQKPELSCEVVPETKAALKHALDHSNEDSYIVVHVDSVPEALEIVKHLKEEYEHHS